MNTFHIYPADHSLAAEAAVEVRQYPPETLLAIRGEWFNGELIVYTVSECPDPDNVGRYEWRYVPAGEWLAEFEARR